MLGLAAPKPTVSRGRLAAVAQCLRLRLMPARCALHAYMRRYVSNSHVKFLLVLEDFQPKDEQVIKVSTRTRTRARAHANMHACMHVRRRAAVAPCHAMPQPAWGCMQAWTHLQRCWWYWQAAA